MLGLGAGTWGERSSKMGYRWDLLEIRVGAVYTDVLLQARNETRGLDLGHRWRGKDM